MLRNCLFIVCIITVLSCDQSRNKDTTVTTTTDTLVEQHKPAPVTPSKDTNALIITPGESIGELKLGDDASLLSQKLGKPDLSDAAMGKAWATWYAKKKDEHNNRPELNVFTTYKDSGMKQVTVQLIRTSSPDFSTTGGIHVYDALADIKKAFPNLKQKGAFVEKATNRTITIYDAVNDGIAFEIASAADQEICIGIIVHPRKKNVMDHYLGFLFSRNWEPQKRLR